MEKQNNKRNILISCREYELCAGGGVQQARMTLGLFQQVTLVSLNVVRKGTKLDNFVSVLKFLYFPSRSASIYLTLVNIFMSLPEK